MPVRVHERVARHLHVPDCGHVRHRFQMITLLVGIVRAFESLSSALAFGIDADRVQPIVTSTIAFMTFAICIVPTQVVTFIVPDYPREKGTKAEMWYSAWLWLEHNITRRSYMVRHLSRVYRPLNHLIFILHSTADHPRNFLPRMSWLISGRGAGSRVTTSYE